MTRTNRDVLATSRLFVLATVAGLLVGVSAAAYFHWMQPFCEVAIANVSDRPIASVRLRYRSAGGIGEVETDAIPPGGIALSGFYMRSEGEFLVEARFADGKSLSGKGGYVQPYVRRKVAISAATVAVQ